MNGAGRIERALVAVARWLERPAGRMLAVPPLRRALRRRARRAWRAADAPVLVCYGNINRSPFAARLAGGGAVSAGLYPVEGRPSPERTVARALAYGVDLSDHRSTVFDPAAIPPGAPVFVFDLENVARIAARYPRLLPRVHLLGSLGEQPIPLIEDPPGRPDVVLQAVLDSVAHAIASART
jgi:protein-tyrosine-phosphatase